MAPSPASSLLPELKQAAVKPVPQDIAQHLGLAIDTFVERHTHAHVEPDVLQLAEGHLHLRHEIPLDYRAFWLRYQQFGHRRPGATKTAILRERVAERAAQKAFLIAPLGIDRQLETAVELQEAVGSDNLAPHRKRLDEREAVAQAELLLARRERRGGSCGEDAAAIEIVVERAPECQLHIAKPSMPRSMCAALLHCDWHRNLVLRAGANAVLIQQLVGHALRTRRHDPRRQHRLVFWKGFLGEERARQVQVATRP